MWPEALEDAGHGIQGQDHGPVSTVTAEVWSSLFWALLFFWGLRASLSAYSPLRHPDQGCSVGSTEDGLCHSAMSEATLPRTSLFLPGLVLLLYFLVFFPLIVPFWAPDIAAYVGGR